MKSLVFLLALFAGPELQKYEYVRVIEIRDVSGRVLSRRTETVQVLASVPPFEGLVPVSQSVVKPVSGEALATFERRRNGVWAPQWSRTLPILIFPDRIEFEWGGLKWTADSQLKSTPERSGLRFRISDVASPAKAKKPKG